MAAVFNLLLISSCLLQWRGGNAFTPAIKDAEILSSTECDDPLSDEPLLEILNELPPPGCNLIHLACSDILRCNPSASSGYYQIQAANGSDVQVYCDMEGTNCGREGGWTRVAHLNMTDTNRHCPNRFKLETTNNTRFCCYKS